MKYLLAVLLLLSACTTTTTQEQGVSDSIAVEEKAGVTTPAGIRYVDEIFPTSAIYVDSLIYSPTYNLWLTGYRIVGDKELNRRCVILLYPGGGTRAECKAWAHRWVRRGYIVLCPDYRNESGEGFTTKDQRKAASDALCANRWARINADTLRINPEAILVMGTSAGGLTAGNAQVTANNPEFYKGDAISNTDNTWTSSSFLGSISISGSISYESQIDPLDRIHIFYNGTSDERFPITKVRRTCDLMKSKGIPAVLIEYPGDHKLGHTDEIVADLFPRLKALLR